MACNYRIGGGTSSYGSYDERWVDCFSYNGVDDINFTRGVYYRDYNSFIAIINSCKSAKTSGLKYRREGWLYNLFNYEPQVLLKGRWYNQKDFKATRLKESEFKISQRDQTIDNLLQELDRL